MTAEKKCPTCGAENSAGAVDGLCPKCLGRLAFSSAPPDGKISELRRLGDYELLEEITFNLRIPREEDSYNCYIGGSMKAKDWKFFFGKICIEFLP